MVIVLFRYVNAEHVKRVTTETLVHIAQSERMPVKPGGGWRGCLAPGVSLLTKAAEVS